MSYLEALELQHYIHCECAEDRSPGALILLEHNPVITLGVKNTSAGNVLVNKEFLANKDIQLVETDRGGDATYHGPGQLVGYPIFQLRDLEVDLHGYLRALEQVIIETIAEYGLKGERNGPAGVWVGEKKVCSIGVAVRRKTTYHGFALNIDPNMAHFYYINPCGLHSEQLASLAMLLGKAPDMNEVRRTCADKFASVFGFESIVFSDQA